MDLIKKEAYASNLYDFILKRKAFQLLYTNKELNSVMLLFLQSLNKRLMKIVRHS